jgi:nitrite reductase (NO-forming)
VRNTPVARACLKFGIALVAVGIAACSPPASSSPSASAPTTSEPPSVTVTLEDNEFVVPGDETVDGVPALTIPVGTTVRFENAGVVDHTASQFSDDFENFDPFGTDFHLQLTPGGTGSVTFDEVGTVEVGCVPHPDMQMLVFVE